jgi:hypothetical protein
MTDCKQFCRDMDVRLVGKFKWSGPANTMANEADHRANSCTQMTKGRK